jgi:hypothetical protein
VEPSESEGFDARGVFGASERLLPPATQSPYDLGGFVLVSMTGAKRDVDEALSAAVLLYRGTTQLPPTPAGPEMGSPRIRSTGASPSIQFASTSEGRRHGASNRRMDPRQLTDQSVLE